jgi:5-methylcytosine-specific restriction endonuclease McrA
MRNIGTPKKTRGTAYGAVQKRISDGDEICAKCGTDKLLTVEHIVPVGLLLDLYADIDTKELGYDLIYNYPENLEIFCKYCNKQKGGRLDMRHPKTLLLLKEALRQVEHGKGGA